MYHVGDEERRNLNSAQPNPFDMHTLHSKASEIVLEHHYIRNVNPRNLLSPYAQYANSEKFSMERTLIIITVSFYWRPLASSLIFEGLRWEWYCMGRLSRCLDWEGDAVRQISHVKCWFLCSLVEQKGRLMCIDGSNITSVYQLI